MKKILLSIFLIGFICQSVNAQNKALFFNGTSDYVEVDDNSAIDYEDSLSIEIWINLDAGTTDGLILAKQWCSGSKYSYNLSIVNSRLRFTWDATGSCANQNYFESTGIIQTQQCTHIAVVFTSTSVELYKDGILFPGSLVGSYGTIRSSSAKLRLGAYKSFGGSFSNFFRGSMDEVRLWDYPLLQSEINSRMNMELTGSETGLTAYYDMEGSVSGTGVTINNGSSTNLLDGTTIGTQTTPFSANSCFLPTNIEKISTQNIIVFPNPTSSELTLTATEQIEKINIIDLTGKTIRTIVNPNNSIDVSELSKGLYFLQVHSKNGISNKRFVKE
ncbi:MAG: T9SS type A sorting domain-containing protein [Vicingaceae bacterium]|nr:T9SS type A sorting domain-containing protein [Vicingaceae bacterium]